MIPLKILQFIMFLLTELFALCSVLLYFITGVAGLFAVGIFIFTYANGNINWTMVLTLAGGGALFAVLASLPEEIYELFENLSDWVWDLVTC